MGPAATEYQLASQLFAVQSSDISDCLPLSIKMLILHITCNVLRCLAKYLWLYVLIVKIGTQEMIVNVFCEEKYSLSLSGQQLKHMRALYYNWSTMESELRYARHPL